MVKYEDINYVDFIYPNEYVTVPAKQILWYSATTDHTIIGSPTKMNACKQIYLEIWREPRGKKSRGWGIVIHYKDGTEDHLLPPLPFWYDHLNDTRNPFVLTDINEYNSVSSVLELYCVRHFSLLWLKMAFKAIWFYLTGRPIIGHIKCMYDAFLDGLRTIFRTHY